MKAAILQAPNHMQLGMTADPVTEPGDLILFNDRGRGRACAVVAVHPHPAARGPHAGDGRLHPQKSPFIKPIDLTDEEKAAVLAFLHSLTDPVFVSDPKLANPWQK